MKDNLLFCGFVLLVFLGVAASAPAWTAVFTIAPLMFADSGV